MRYIIPDVTKRLVEIDDDLLERARAILEQETIKGTVDAALRSVVDREAGLAFVEWLRQRDDFDLEAFEASREPDFPLQDE